MPPMLSTFLGGLPDSRALFRYRLSQETYRLLQTTLTGVHRNADEVYHALFCLFVSEWFRRDYAKGARSWQPILTLLQLNLSIAETNEWTTSGLKRLKREVHVSEGRRHYLNTLITEGGFPYKLVQRDSGSFARFFQSLLERNDANAPIEQWRQHADHIKVNLARSFQHASILDSAVHLAKVFSHLTQDLPENATDPIAHFDERHPGWRDRLPFLIEDKASKDFVSHLAQTSRDVPQIRRKDLRFNGTLNQASGCVERQLSVPICLNQAQVAALFAGTDTQAPTSGVYSLIVYAKNHPPTTVGKVCFSANADLAWSFTPVHCAPCTSENTLHVKLRRRTHPPLHLSGIRGSSALTNQPLVFAPDSKRLLAVGAMKSRKRSVLVGLPKQYSCGQTPEFILKRRRYYLVHNTLSATNGTRVFTFMANSATNESVEISGARLIIPGSTQTLWRGWPRPSRGTLYISITKPHNGVPRRRWERLRDLPPTHGGFKVQVRENSGAILLQTHLKVLPSDFQWRSTGTQLLFTSKHLHRASVDHRLTRHGDTWRYASPAQSDDKPSVTLSFGTLDVRFPAPHQRLAFTHAGLPLVTDQHLPLCRLARTQISAYSTHLGRSFYLSIHGDHLQERRYFRVYDAMDLSDLSSLIAQHIAHAPSGEVRLSLSSNGVDLFHSIRVSRYDWSLSATSHQISLLTSAEQPVISQHAQVQAHHFGQLDAPHLLPKENLGWTAPLSTPMKLITATNEGIPRATPLLFGESAAPTLFEQAIRNNDPETIMALILDAFRQPEVDPIQRDTHASDQLLAEISDLLSASHLIDGTPLFQAIQTSDEALAHLALHFALQHTAVFFDASGDRGISWDMIGIRHWTTAIACYEASSFKLNEAREALRRAARFITPYTTTLGLALWSHWHTSEVSPIEIAGLPEPDQPAIVDEFSRESVETCFQFFSQKYADWKEAVVHQHQPDPFPSVPSGISTVTDQWGHKHINDPAIESILKTLNVDRQFLHQIPMPLQAILHLAACLKRDSLPHGSARYFVQLRERFPEHFDTCLQIAFLYQVNTH